MNRVWNPFRGYTLRRGERTEAYKITTQKGFVIYVPVSDMILCVRDTKHPKSHSIKCGTKHLVPSLLKENDMIKLHVGWEEPDKKYGVTEQEARVMGYFLGAGAVTKGKYRITTPVEGVRNDIIEYADGQGWKLRFRGNSITIDGIEEWVRRHGLGTGKWNYSWMIMSRKNMSAFIGAIWAVRGNMIFKTDGRVHIGLKLPTKDLIDGVQIALLRLGVVADYKAPTEDGKPHRLDISPMRIAKEFAKRVGPVYGQEDRIAKIHTLSEGRVVNYEWERIKNIKRVESCAVAPLGGTAAGVVVR